MLVYHAEHRRRQILQRVMWGCVVADFDSTNYPLGVIVAYMGPAESKTKICDDDGSAWLLCDGALLDQQGQYGPLFRLVGDQYGVAGDQFNLPDLRGYFVRVLDTVVNGSTSGRDPGASSNPLQRTPIMSGSNTLIGSRQQHSAGPHTHALSGFDEAKNSLLEEHKYFVHNSNDPNEVTHSTTDSSDTSYETRPRNVALNFIIRALAPAEAPAPPPRPFGLPVGSVVYTSVAEPQTEDEKWFPCDGSVEPQDRFVDDSPVETPLFQAIGITFGEGDGKTTFTMPDLRGYFARGNDKSPASGAAGNDPDVSVRHAFTSKRGPADVGSTQAAAVLQHWHSIPNSWGWLQAPGPTNTIKRTDVSGLQPWSYTASTISTAGGEEYSGLDIRPVNTALAAAILGSNAHERLPIGSIVQYAGDNDPSEESAFGDVWLICDGRTLTGNYTDYTRLFYALFPENTPGAPVKLPDLRGLFIRGYDPTNTVDRNDARGPMFFGTKPPTSSSGLTGVQGDRLGPHVHGILSRVPADHKGGSDLQGSSGDYDGGDPKAKTDGVSDVAAVETRPINIALHHIIRVQ